MYTTEVPTLLINKNKTLKKEITCTVTLEIHNCQNRKF